MCIMYNTVKRIPIYTGKRAKADKTMLALQFALIVCRIELFFVYLQGSFDLVKSFVTRRPEHGGFLVIITHCRWSMLFSEQ